MNNATTKTNESFIRHDQFNFIKFQTDAIVRGHVNAKDTNVLKALKGHALEKVLNLFPELSIDQKVLLENMIHIEEKAEADQFLTELKPYVIPFRNITEKTVKKLFSKVKKLKVPDFDKQDFTEYSFFGWNDVGTGRKYIIAEYEGKLIGMHGTFRHSNQKGVCTICNGIEEIGLFMTRVKSGKETYTDRGNYICYDSEKCNQNLITLDHLHEFIGYIKK